MHQKNEQDGDLIWVLRIIQIWSVICPLHG